MKAVVLIRPKRGILDPQGDAVRGSLQKLGFAVVQASTPTCECLPEKPDAPCPPTQQQPPPVPVPDQHTQPKRKSEKK